MLYYNYCFYITGRVKKRSTLLHASAGLNPQIQGKDKLVLYTSTGACRGGGDKSRLYVGRGRGD